MLGPVMRFSPTTSSAYSAPNMNKTEKANKDMLAEIEVLKAQVAALTKQKGRTAKAA